jgi:hypothetical protein
LLSVSLALTLLQGLTGTGGQLPPSPGSPSAVIAVIVSEAATSSMLDALNRLRGEASSVGFELRLVEPPAGATPQTGLAQVARELSPAAVVALSSDGYEREDQQTIRAIDVWFLDQSSGKLSVGHLSVDKDAGERAKQALAVGVVDFIRARMFDSLVRASVESKVERPRSAPPIPLGRYQVLAGFGGIGSFSGFSPALLPFVEASVTLRPWLRLSLAGGGFGTQVRQETRVGSVAIEQRLLKTGVTFVGPALARRWYLHAETGLSILFVATHGEGNIGYSGHSPSGFSPGVYCSGGVLLAFTSRVVFHSSLGTLWLLREQQVYIDDHQVARTGRPAWLASAMLGVMF